METLQMLPKMNTLVQGLLNIETVQGLPQIETVQGKL